MYRVLCVQGIVCTGYCMYRVLYVQCIVCTGYCMYRVLYVQGIMCIVYIDALSHVICRYKYTVCPFFNVTQKEMGGGWNKFEGVLG